jgi:hypothetical protein
MQSTILALQTRGGCCVCVSDTVIVVGVFDENKQHTSVGCSTVVTDLVMYLKSTGK